NLFEQISDGYALEFTENDFVCILTQLYWTLCCFERFGISHNDLHLENILLKIISKPEVLSFLFEEIDHTWTLVRLQTRYLVKIYDMDQASATFPGVSRN